MDATSILKNAAQSAVGQIEKAMIEIIDERGGETSLEGPVSMGGGSLAAGLSAIPGGLEGFRDAASSALKAGVSAVGAAAASFGSIIKGILPCFRIFDNVLYRHPTFQQEISKIWIILSVEREPLFT